MSVSSCGAGCHNQIGYIVLGVKCGLLGKLSQHLSTFCGRVFGLGVVDDAENEGDLSVTVSVSLSLSLSVSVCHCHSLFEKDHKGSCIAVFQTVLILIKEG